MTDPISPEITDPIPDDSDPLAITPDDHSIYPAPEPIVPDPPEDDPAVGHMAPTTDE